MSAYLHFNAVIAQGKTDRHMLYCRRIVLQILVVCRKGHLVALDVIRGLVFLHSNKVVHADLKGKNILLTQNAGMNSAQPVTAVQALQNDLSMAECTQCHAPCLLAQVQQMQVQ